MDDDVTARRTLVVIPTYQEAGSISELLKRLHSSTPDVAVLIVDDSSPDGTAAVAEAMKKEIPALEIMVRPEKGGLGSACRDGFRWGLDRDFDVLVEMDADLSHDPSELLALLEEVADGADLAIGSRYVPGGNIPGWSFYRRQLSRWGNVYAAEALQLGVRDATSGFRAYRAEILRKLDLNGVRADGYGFQIEMVYRVLGAGGRVTEVPIGFHERTSESSKMSGRIITEALWLVTKWGLKDTFHHRSALRKHRRRELKRSRLPD